MTGYEWFVIDARAGLATMVGLFSVMCVMIFATCF